MSQDAGFVVSGRNYGLVPMPGQATDTETQLARLRDYMVADRDEEAAKRARDYYGEGVPIDHIGEEDKSFFAGAAFARINGVPNNPEAYWHNQKKDIPDVEREQMFELMGRELVTQTQQEWDAQKALADERVQAFDGMLRDIVQKADADGKGEDWAKFLDAYDRGVWGSKEETEKLAYSVRNAAEAFGMMLGMMDEYTDAGANVLTDSTSAVLMLDRLRGDEVAEGLFFGALQRQVQENLDEAQQKAFWERFGRAFSASTKELTAGLMGGHFKAFVTDEQVDEYNAELEKARKVSGLKRPNVSLYAEGDNWLEKVLPVGNARLKMVRTAARESGQLNEDGSLRYMSDEERMSTEELNAFRGKLYNAVNGIYDVKGAAALLGRMAPTSMAYLLPGGAIASGVSMYTQNLAQQLGEGETWTRSSTVGAVNAMIQASVEKIAFGSLNPGKMVPGLDRLMSHRLMARALGGIYGTTAGRVGMNVLVGAAEEAFVEPTAGLLLAGIYNAFSSDYFDLDDPVGEYRKEITEMLQPDQLLATALYGLLLGGVSISGHKKAAVDYSVTRSMLMEMGVEEGRAAQVARIDDPVARAKATQELIGQQLKVDAKGVLGYMAELYPQLQDMATVENYFDKGKLPKILPGENGMVRVREKDADGKVTEVQLSEESAGLMVQARMEVLTAREMTDMADMVLGAAMVGNLKQDGNRWQVEEVGERMDYAYFRRLSRAAGVKLANGAKESAVDKSVHEFLPLGTLARQGRAWEDRMRVYRHDLEQKLGRELTEEEWQVEEKKAFSRVNRTKMRGRDGGVRTLLRVARGGFTAMEVLEDVTEDNLVRDMESNGRTLDYYTSNLQELELAMGKPGAFLRRLKDEDDAFTSMDVVEAMGKLVQSKVLADTARSGNRLSAALNAFLDMLRSWVLRAKAMFELGTRLNKLLEDKEALAKVESEFLADIDRLVAQDVEWLESLQLKEGLEAMFRAANAAAATATPVLDEAEAEHGEAVRAEIAAKEELQRKVDADVAAGEAALEGNMSSSVVNQQELDDIKAAAERDGTFMKAPNGKPTKLTEYQWLQVRTKAFKGWFGDWEKVARFNSAVQQLLSMSEVASITGTEFAPDGRKLTDKVTEFWNKEYGGVAKNPVLGDVVLDTRSVKASIAHGVGRLKSAAFAVVHDVIERGVLMEIAPDWKGRGEDSYVIAAPVQIGNTAYVCEVVVMKGETRTGFYLHEVQIKEKLLDVFKTGVVTGTSGASKSILLDVWQRVKQIEENCSKVVDENGEPRVVYHGARHAGFRVFDNEEGERRSNAPDGTSFFSSSRAVAYSYAGRWDEPDLHNKELQEEIEEYGIGYMDAGLYEVFLNIRDPHTIDFKGRNWQPDEPFYSLVDEDGDYIHPMNGDEYYNSREEAQARAEALELENYEIYQEYKDTNIVAEEGMDMGADGVIIENVIDEGSYGYGDEATDYVVFSSNQVKSATQNLGTFDGSNADITFSVIGPKAKTWDRYKHRAFTGRDDGKLRVELDTSGVRLKKAPRHRTDDSVAKDLLRRLAVWRAAVAERGRLKAVQRAVKDEAWMADIMPELTYLVRQMSWMGLDYKSFSDMQGAGLIELAMNEDATLEEAKAAVKGRKVKGVLGFNKLGEVLDFPELYAAYPELRQMPVLWMDDKFNLRGSYAPEGERSVRKISVRANRSQGGILSTLLHEVQHWIQDKEGFSYGAMPEQSLVELGIPEGTPVHQLAAGEIEARNVQARRWMSAEERAAMPFNETLTYPGQALSYTLDDLRSTMSVTNAQEQGLFKDGVLETENAVVVEPGATFSVTALHATPHRFRKFTTDNMGTGEGNRAFGWGLYFAESEKVNKNYYQYFTKNAQQPTLYVIAGDIVSFEDWKKYVNSLIDKVVGDKLYNRDSLVYSFMFKDEKEGSKLLASRRKLLRENKRRLKEEKEAEYKELWASNIELMNDSIEIISAMLSDGVFAKKTAMNYRVELNVDASNLFDWDNVVGSEIYEEVDKLGGVYNLSMDKEKATGAGVYRILSLLLGSDKAASEWLAERGYKGIKYLDGNSRQKVKGTYNYVIFSGDDVKITGVNETGDYNAEWEDYVDETASFSVSMEELRVALSDAPADKASLITRLKSLAGRKFYNKAANLTATISGESAKKIVRAELETIANLTRLGYTETEASLIHRAAATKIGELYEQAVLFFVEDVYHKADDRKAAWHFFEPVTVDFGGRDESFLCNITVIDFTHGGERLFSLEMTIENPIRNAEDRTAPASGRSAQHPNGASGVRIAAFESFVKKEKSQIERSAREKGLIPWRVDEARVHELQGEAGKIEKEIEALLAKFGGDEEKLQGYRRDQKKLHALRQELAVRQAAIAAEYKPESMPDVPQPIAPNGKPSRLSVDAWLTVRTKAFKTWFGDWENDPANASKVVDENEEPLVVYHGSSQWFRSFNNGKERHQSGAPDGTIFANDNREIAVSFVDYYGGKAADVILGENDARHARMSWGVYRKGGIYPLFMNLRNPLVVDFKGMTWHGEKYDIKDVNWYAEEARKSGHDGLIVRNVIDVGFTDTNSVPPSTDYVAFDSTQVKSATDNRGTFDGSNPDITLSVVRMDEERLVSDMVAAGGGFKANVEFTEKMVKEMRNTLQRLRRLSGKTRTDREDAIAAMGSIVHMVKAVVQYLPKGYRFSVHPYLNKLETLAEMAATGDIDLTEDIAPKDVVDMEGSEGMNRRNTLDEMVKEYGNVKLVEALERIINRVNEQLRKHAKDRTVEKITELMERLAPKKDAKTGKLKGGKMSADAYRDLEDVAIALGMDEDDLKAKLDGLNAQLAAPGLTEEQRDVVESQIAVYDQFGNLKAMTPEEALAAYESLRQRVWLHRFEWDNIMAEKRAARRAVINRVVDGVGTVSDNEYNAAKRVKRGSKRVKSVGNILSNMPQVLHGLSGYLPLQNLARDMALRANMAGEKIKAWESERWAALEVLSKKTLKKSWRLCMDDMHKVQGSGVTFRRPKYRTVSARTEELRELLKMTPHERKAEMKQRRAAGGLMAETVLSEKDIAALQSALEKMEKEGRELSRVETKYISDYRVEENLKLSKGEALYAILMFEQPTYTERLMAQGYTEEVIAGLKEYIGEGMLEFGYGMRELFAIQGDRIAAVYEGAFGVPFPREENYFAARWVVNGMKENPAEQLLAGMMGTPGAGNGWQKQRVDHNLELDMTKDALQVFLQATKLTDTWMATQDIVADFKAWTRDSEFERALTVLIGKDNYDNLKDWIRILEMGGVQDCLNMGAAQEVINGLYGSGAVAILGFRLQTLVRQVPAVFNGLLGAHDISTGEWLATLARMKHGEAPMTFKRMVESALMKNRQSGKDGAMAGQAARPGDMQSSLAEEIMQASMRPMEWVDARCTAIGLVPVWNVYYARAVKSGASHEEAEQAAWEQTALVANMSSQPVGFLNKSKIAQSKNPLVKTFFYMLSENMAKVSMCQALWKSGNKKAALRGWLFYGAANAAISALLDYLQGDPEEWEKGKWLEYVLSAFYGPLASMPGIGEAVAALGTGFLKGVGYAFDDEELQKARTHAGAARAIFDVEGAGRAVSRMWEYLTDDEEHGFSEYSRELSKFSRTLAIGTGWLGNAVGYWSTVVAVCLNPVDLAARMYRNFQHYYGEE